MTVVLATIATIFMMMPGFGFITGVNLTDKNIREIVFRNTPAEIAYVVTVSLGVHFIFALLPLGGLNPAELIGKCVALYYDLAGDPEKSSHVRPVVLFALSYVVISSVAGLLVGLLLGLAVRHKWTTVPTSPRFLAQVLGWATVRHRRAFFVKHRWMLDLVGDDENYAIFARVLTAASLALSKDLGGHAIVVEGIIRDCYFGADGTLLYLVFATFNEKLVNLAEPPFVGNPVAGTSGSMMLDEAGQLVIEGKQVALVRYERIRIPALRDPNALDAIRRATDESP